MYHSLVNNSDEGDVDVFEAESVRCVDCLGERILRKGDWMHDDADHKLGCLYDRNPSDALLRAVSIGWHYAFGTEGYAWEEDPVGPFVTEGVALYHASREYWDKINDAAVACVEASREY